jgi:hypothetical protein
MDICPICSPTSSWVRIQDVDRKVVFASCILLLSGCEVQKEMGNGPHKS